MHHTMIQRNVMQLGSRNWVWLLLLFLLVAGTPEAVKAVTLDARYPGLSTGLLKSAVLAPMDEDTLLHTDDVTITRSQLLAGIQDQDPGMRSQLKKNLFFVLEQEALRQLLLHDAQSAGISVSDGDDNQAIQALFEYQTKALSVAEEEIRAFYAANKEMVGDASFDQVADNIRQYLLQEKKQQAVTDYIAGVGNLVQLRINEKWVETQSRLAMDNPVDQARRSGKPTMVEFGTTGCKPCDMMQPILDSLRKNYSEKLNVVFIHVREEQILSSRYGIRSIPVQVFYDAQGKEVSRHVGFYAEKEVLKQLEKAGL